MSRFATSMLVAIFALGAIGVVPTLAQAEPSVVAGTVVIDDLSADFRRVGGGWRTSLGGYDNHHFWAPARRSQSKVGIWSVEFDEPGLYKVQAKIPSRHASSRKVVYKLKTEAGWTKRVRNQYANRGSWMSLGVHVLAATVEVRLSDRTLDPRGSGRKLAFDAIRFVPLDPPDPPVITRLDVEPKLDRAIATFSLAEPGPAKTEYRKAGTTTWLLGATETSSTFADHRQVIGDLRSETDYELRVIATNKGGRTISPITRFRTLAPPPPPDPPVITDLDVEPRHDRAIVTFSLAEPGPAKTEYRKAGTTTWLLGANETSSDYADHRQVIRDLKSETDYELRVIATNKGGRTISPITRFTTTAPPPPVIKDIDVTPKDTRAIVRFSLAEKGPAKTEYRKDGASTWRDGPNETSYEHKDHRQVIRGLSPGTAYELQVIATNAAGTTTSDLVRFTTTGSRPVTLVTPAAGAQIPQNNPSIGCPLNPTRGHGFQLEFDWTGPSLKRLGAYQLRVWHEGARYPAVRSDFDQSEFRWRSCNAFVQDGNLSDWYWQVTVVDNQGRRTDVTEKRPFSFLPCRLADGRRCHAPAR